MLEDKIRYLSMFLKSLTIVSSLVFSMFFFTACATTKHVSNLTPKEYKSSEVSVLFYKDDTNTKQPTTVLLKDRVVGVILPNQYLKVSTCAGTFPVAMSTRLPNKTMQTQTLNVQAQKGSTVYIRGNSSNLVVTPELVSIANEQDITKGKNFGTYAVNRYVPNCEMKNIEYIDIAADVLFAFNSSKLSPKGVEVINTLATELKSRTGIQKMVVEGHTDRLGSDTHNNQLSLNRAASVANQLKSQGVMLPMALKGMGKKVPVTNGCYGVSPKAKLHECLQPDRRVRIELIGNTLKPVESN